MDADHISSKSPLPGAGMGASSTGVEASSAPAAPTTIERHPTTATASDVESQVTAGSGRQRLPRYTAESDPYGLSCAFKTESDLETIKANISRKRDVSSYVTPVGAGHAPKTQGMKNIESGRTAGGLLNSCVPLPRSGRSKLQARNIASFYNKQNETIERLLKSVEEHCAEARQEAGDDHLRLNIAVYGSFAANIILAGLQLYGAIASGSLSLFVTMADSVFDPLSNITLILSHRAVRRVDPNKFPSGKARLETVGNIIFCFLMIAVSLILIAFSCQDLSTTPPDAELNAFHFPAVIAVCIAFATKFTLFLYCWALKDKYSQVDILWQDHRNDLFVNGFGVLTSVGGSKLAWYIDPTGAIILSLFISGLWLHTAFEEFMLLVGKAASVEMQQQITYVCMTHNEAIRQIDTVRVYHSGPRLIAEVDVVMDPLATLQSTHDVAEELQIKLESLPDVERAYVHIDYETTHKPEHSYKKDL